MTQGGTPDPALDKLAPLLTQVTLKTAQSSRDAAGTDWRGRFSGPVLAVAEPETPEQVALVVKWAQETQTAIVPQGGNSSLAGGAVPLGDGPPALVLSTSRMNKIRSLDPESGVMIAEAGLILEDAQAAAAPREVPVDLGSRGTAQLGGLLSAHAGGLNVVRYGALRNHVLGLEAVLPNGEIWHGLAQVKKNNVGYDLRNLLIGAEGTLGIITAASLQLSPPAGQRLSFLVSCLHVSDALGVVRALEPSFGGHIHAAELMPAIAIQRALETQANCTNPFGGDVPPWALLIEIGLRDGLVDVETDLAFETLSQACEHPGVLTMLAASSSSQREAFWALREGLVLAQREYGASIKHDVCVPVSKAPEFIERGLAIALETVPGCIPVPFGHLGDGSFHFNISRPTDGGDDAFFAMTPALNRAIHDLVHEMGGSISAEHGLGQYRSAEANRLRDPAQTWAMKQIKAALDPDGLFNPGKVFA